MYVTKIFVSLGYCWPSEVFDQGTPSQIAEPSLRHRSTLSKSPLPKACLSLWYFWVLPFCRSRAVMDIPSWKPVKVDERNLLLCDCNFMVTSFPSETPWTPYHSSSLWTSLRFGNISFSCIPAKNMRENIKARILYNKWASHNDPSGRVYVCIFFFFLDSDQAWCEVHPVKSVYHSLSRITAFMESHLMTCSFKIWKTLNLHTT